MSVEIDTAGIDRVGAYVNDRPFHTVDLTDAKVAFELSAARHASARVELRGFEKEVPVGTRRLTL